MFADQGRSRLARVAAALTFSMVAVLTLSQSALADTISGQTGNYLYTDDSSHKGAVCRHDNSSAHPAEYWLSKVTVVPPSLWWPDQNAGNTNEHGTVGWRFTLQNDVGGTWHTIKQTDYVKSTAYEDSQNPYSPATKAHFKNRSVNINGHNYTPDTTWRVIVRSQWYRKNGSVLGSATHNVTYYEERLGTTHTDAFSLISCITKLQDV